MTNAVYVSNAQSGSISVFTLDEHGGRLDPVQEVTLGGMLMPMALSPDRRLLYVARRSEPLAVVTLAIDAASGHLSVLGEAALPHSMAYLATDRSGRWLFSASYGGNLVAISPIAADGLPKPAQQVIETGPHAHCIQASLDNRHVYATSLGGNVVMHWHFDAETGALTNAEPFAFEAQAGAGARHFVFDAAGQKAYLLGELDGSVTVLDVDAHTGTMTARQTLSSLPPGFAGQPWASDIHLHPSGRFLYTSERHSSTLAIFSVDGADGTLRRTAHVDTETQPRGFAIDPGGRFLIAAGQLSNRVSVYLIDGETGFLAPCACAPAGQDPNWVEILPLSN
ncbi:lactonase family protein [Variovorax dokdonensis]|uniref:Lactonase family protein n=1 Tax=Variovorax dokdonensis TaxID=344883 RepID=A0ABT7NHA6_9BURK|nr:lactonase family protein [Variovorax dokdonensis]MDM0047329.1 lactonase family protein [Variovorax dokdonensis]